MKNSKIVLSEIFCLKQKVKSKAFAFGEIVPLRFTVK